MQRQNVSAATASDPAYFRAVMLLSQPKIKSIEELPAYTAYFFTEDFPVDARVRDKVMAKGDPQARLRELAQALTTADFPSEAALEETIKATATKNGPWSRPSPLAAIPGQTFRTGAAPNRPLGLTTRTTMSKMYVETCLIPALKK